MMTVTYTLSHQDCVNYFIDLKKKTLRQNAKIIGPIILWLLLQFLVLIILENRAWIHDVLILVCLFLITTIILSTFGSNRRQYERYVKKLLSSDKSANLTGSQTYTLNDDYIECIDAYTYSKIQYIGIKKIKKTSSFMFFYVGELIYHYIPLSAFETPVLAEEFIAVLCEKTGLMVSDPQAASKRPAKRKSTM